MFLPRGSTRKSPRADSEEGEQNNNGSFGLFPRRHCYLYYDGEAPSTVSLFDFSLKLAPSTIFVSNQRRRRAPIAPETTTLPSSSATARSDDKGAVTFVHCRAVLLPYLLFTAPGSSPLLLIATATAAPSPAGNVIIFLLSPVTRAPLPFFFFPSSCA
ncbi:hypothetical protein PIB30_014308 [Stylosanthes scabra]|uniref:Uncharacterized protein n=1 Tax=Stylosanthes scabra TaxID=79078 RepID=A0ABU6V7Q5_9FABA|nr:hypothetical protein [Stylosanthes scabra]